MDDIIYFLCLVGVILVIVAASGVMVVVGTIIEERAKQIIKDEVRDGKSKNR
jgi:ABC-type antimicrobial peptide transport system permease subunit